MNYQKACLVIGTLTLFIVGSDIFMASPLLPFISKEFNLSIGSTGWMVTLYAIAYAIGCPLWGSLSDRKGRKNLIIIGLLCVSLSNLLASLAASFPLLTLSRMLVGFSLSTIAPLIYAMIGDVAPPGKKGSWLSIVVAGHLTGLAIGTPLGSTLVHYLGWRTVFGSIAAVSVVLALGNFLLLPKGSFEKIQIKSSIYSLKDILLAVSITAFWSTATYGLYTYLGAGLYLQYNYSSLQIGKVLIIYGIGAMLGSIAAGKFSDRFGGKRIATISLFGLTFLLVVIGFIFTFEHLLLIGIFVWAVVGYAYIPSYQARLVRVYANEKGKIMAWNITAMYIGMTLGSLAGGAILSKWGFEALPFLCGGIALVAGFTSMKKSRLERSTII